MNKKLYAKVLTAAALLSAVALPAQAATTFTDIEGSYARDAILELVNAGILNGKGNGEFDPTGKIERQDFAIILARALGLDLGQVPASATFAGVPTEHYA
ncbi:S-layer homology domain-containing protein [Paenibacillus macerans]|uniref:S-layer homology domain-containing protein n=1 Tax=Paenibacillus macerans TaxID=44252 RepID=UPI003D31695E